MNHSSTHPPQNFSERLTHFFHTPMAGGVVLIACTIVALVLSNLEATGEWFHHLWLTPFSLGFEGFGLTKPFELWINDALMAVFFFAVGLEIKREIVAGELRSIGQASLPIAAAVGGMVVPALIFVFFNAGGETLRGWGIPMATDIAFALGILMMLGKRVPVSLKIFLTALAIVDDLGAILVIALFYSSELDWAALLSAAAVFAFLVVLNRMNVHKMRWYLVPAVALWVLFLKSGVHATIAGVLIAFVIPASSRYSKELFTAGGRKLLERFKEQDRDRTEVLSNEEQHETLQNMRVLARGTISPIQRLEFALHPCVTFLIMPLFALANAGVVFSSEAVAGLTSAPSLGIVLGLVVGKPLGILLFSWLVVRLNWAAMPVGATWSKLTGVAILGGIGFTMSIFIDNLAFAGNAELISLGKIAILIASVLAGVLGSLVLIRAKQ